MHLQNIQEAYMSIYEPKDQLLEETLLEQVGCLFDLTEEEQVETLEESILDFLYEGYDIHEIAAIFEEVLNEYQITYSGESGSGSAKVTTGSGSKKAAQQRLSDRKDRKRKEAIDKVKDTVRKAATGAHQKAKEAKFKAVYEPAVKYANKRGIGGPGAGLKARSKDPEKRHGLLKTVAKDIGQRAVNKLQRGAEKVRSAGEKAVGSVKSSSDKFQDSVSNTKTKVKEKGKSLVGRFARKVSDKVGKVASRLGEEYEDIDNYDLVMGYLLDEGYAETEEDAKGLMFNMSEEWIDEIIEAKVDDGMNWSDKTSTRNKREFGHAAIPQNKEKANRIRREYHSSIRGKKRKGEKDDDYDYGYGVRRGPESPTDK